MLESIIVIEYFSVNIKCRMIGLTELLLLSLPLLGIAINKIVNHNPEAIFSVYQRPNGYYWLKVFLVYIFLYAKQLTNRIKTALGSGDELLKYQEELEKDQNLSLHPQAINAVYFTAGNVDGDHLSVGMVRRKNQLIDGYLYIKINREGIGLLQSSKLPDTSLYQTEFDRGFEAEGISVQCLEPLSVWKIKYKGEMRTLSDPPRIFKVNLEMTYTSDLPIINYETTFDPLTTAKSIALERWNREYFQLLKEYHQTTYEQHGKIEGNVTVEGESFYLDLDSSKIRTLGVHTEWRNVHRYNLHMFFTENGDRFTIGEFCFPLTVSSFKMGFVYSTSDKKVYPITYNDFQLYQHGESGKLPLDYAFTIEAGRKTYTIKVDVIDSPEFYISKDWECKIVQRICSFQVNSLKGLGISECQQRNLLGRDILESIKSSQKMVQSNETTESPSRDTINEENQEKHVENTVVTSNDNLYSCEHCSKICSSRVQLWKHLRTHDSF